MVQSADARKRRHRGEAHAIRPGDECFDFDFDDVPLRIPGERFATSVIDVRDLVLPESESGLFPVLVESLSYSADDPRLREALRRAGRAEASHADACVYVHGGGSRARWARMAVVGSATLTALVLASAYMYSKTLRRKRYRSTCAVGLSGA